MELGKELTALLQGPLFIFAQMRNSRRQLLCQQASQSNSWDGVALFCPFPHELWLNITIYPQANNNC